MSQISKWSWALPKAGDVGVAGTWRCSKCGRILTRFVKEGELCGNGKTLTAKHFKGEAPGSRYPMPALQECEGVLQFES